MAACMPRMSRLEEGSGTMAGVMLVMLVGVALSATACIGNLVVCQNRARSLADLIAFGAAYAAWHGWADDPCAFAGQLAVSNSVALPDCMVQSDDVQVTVAVDTAVPLTPRVQRTALAGPAECDKGGASE